MKALDRAAMVLLASTLAGLAGCSSRPAAPPPFIGTWRAEDEPRAFLRFAPDGSLNTWKGDLSGGPDVVLFEWRNSGHVINATVKDPRHGMMTQKFDWSIRPDGKLELHSTEVEDGRTVHHDEVYSRVE